MIKKISILILAAITFFSLVFLGCDKVKEVPAGEIQEAKNTESEEQVQEKTEEEAAEEGSVQEETEEEIEEAAGEAGLQTPEGEVSFQTEDGTDINGNIFGTGNKWVILSHMYPTDQTSWFDFAQYLADNGYIVLTYDFKGYSKSGGSKDVRYIDKDLEAALDFVRQYDAEKVFLIGASMGGTASLVVASRQAVDGVVSISSPTEWKGLSALNTVVDIDAPKFFIASQGDGNSAASADTLHQASLEPKGMLILDGSAHGTYIFDEEPENGKLLKMQILSFLDIAQSPGEL